MVRSALEDELFGLTSLSPAPSSTPSPNPSPKLSPPWHASLLPIIDMDLTDSLANLEEVYPATIPSKRNASASPLASPMSAPKHLPDSILPPSSIMAPDSSKEAFKARKRANRKAKRSRTLVEPDNDCEKVGYAETKHIKNSTPVNVAYDHHGAPVVRTGYIGRNIEIITPDSCDLQHLKAKEGFTLVEWNGRLAFSQNSNP
jgi:hypothetical protein